MDVLTAVRKIVTSWDAMTPDSIQHCWIHTGIFDAAILATLRQKMSQSASSRLLISMRSSRSCTRTIRSLPTRTSRMTRKSEEWMNNDKMDVDSRSIDEDEINRLLTHWEPLALCEQLATYTFAHGIESRYVLEIVKQYRKQVLGTLRRTSITLHSKCDICVYRLRSPV